jgi:hypothetical protein
MRNYPIQTFLLWRTKEEIRARRFMPVINLDANLSDFYDDWSQFDWRATAREAQAQASGGSSYRPSADCRLTELLRRCGSQSMLPGDLRQQHLLQQSSLVKLGHLRPKPLLQLGHPLICNSIKFYLGWQRPSACQRRRHSVQWMTGWRFVVPTES